MADWLDRLKRRVTTEGHPMHLTTVLDAFATDGPPPDPTALDVARALAGEVDPGQAQMFARRFEAVRNLPGEASWTLLREALDWRMAGILAGPSPRARRVRALVDFYFAQAAVLRWADPSLPEPTELLPPWRAVGPGLRHATLSAHTAWGPIHVNLLEVEAGAARLETLDSRGLGLTELVASRGALAGVSGGFFLYSEPDIEPPSTRGDPVGLLVHDGQVMNPPWLRRAALVQHTSGRVELGPVVVGGPRWTRAHGGHSPPDAGPVCAVVGTQVVARGTGALPIPLAGAVVPDPPPTWDPHTVHSAMAGGPMLLVDGRIALDLEAEEFAGTAPPVTFSQDETFDQNLLPRMGVGQRPDGSLLFCAVDGRDFDRAPGMTLRQVARLLRSHGCVRAMNLDGGSSKRMVVEGRVVDLPSTEVVSGGGRGPVRPVHSAILIHPR